MPARASVKRREEVKTHLASSRASSAAAAATACGDRFLSLMGLKRRPRYVGRGVSWTRLRT
jgi:hypothetical protein